jgi:hypothetical protein
MLGKTILIIMIFLVLLNALFIYLVILGANINKSDIEKQIELEEEMNYFKNLKNMKNKKSKSQVINLLKWRNK